MQGGKRTGAIKRNERHLGHTGPAQEAIQFALQAPEEGRDVAAVAPVEQRVGIDVHVIEVLGLGAARAQVDGAPAALEVLVQERREARDTHARRPGRPTEHSAHNVEQSA